MTKKWNSLCADLLPPVVSKKPAIDKLGIQAILKQLRVRTLAPALPVLITNLEIKALKIQLTELTKLMNGKKTTYDSNRSRSRQTQLRFFNLL